MTREVSMADSTSDFYSYYILNSYIFDYFK